ncbi:NAD(P)H-quinone oxidoreductase [Taklimakanibacter deserti]|uniref:NAD(P)H-quinone oxidoreductase n=1 Tax=Taklimakanibacter deserti TaxID=2267839 RepID=UPI000E64FF08
MTALPREMTAIAITKPGGPDVLKPQRIAVPVPKDHEILIKVEAAGVNRPDVLQRQGGYPPPPGAPSTPGLEVAGKVVAGGASARRYKEGDAVLALVPGGGYAEYCAAAEDNALPIPEGLSMSEAGGIPETFFTVWTNVFERAGLKPNETFLVHGGSSGIGTSAIMMAHHLGARVFATAGSPEKCRACEKLGAERGIDYRAEDFVQIVKDATQGKGADVILDMVGGDYVGRNLAVAAMHGRIVNIAFLKGSKVEVDLLPIMLKRLILTGSTLRPRSVAEKAEIARALEAKVWPLLAEGKIRPQIYKTFPLAEAAEAHRLMESSAHVGKIMLVP